MKLQNSQSIFVVFILTACCVAHAQLPPRISIPGAVPVSTSRSNAPARVRRPVALKAQHSLNPSSVPVRIVEEPKPVTESEEDDVPDVYLPQLLREQQLAQAQQVQFQQAAAAFLNNEPNILQESQAPHFLNHDDPFTTRFPERSLPPPTSQPNPKPVFNDFGIGSNIINSPRFSQERQQSSPVPAPQRERANVIRNRPTAVREQRPQYDAQPVQTPQRPRPKPIAARPIVEQNQIPDDRDHQNKRQRIVAQTIRKWREEHEDGSITWGYENDDGSFKEELIGVDCITKGTYGYVDPDGNKREYHYETGIKCDPNRRNEDEALQENGFVNYEDNKAVLPNGIEIDMSQLGKKKSKRPGANYRN